MVLDGSVRLQRRGYHRNLRRRPRRKQIGQRVDARNGACLLDWRTFARPGNPGTVRRPAIRGCTAAAVWPAFRSIKRPIRSMRLPVIRGPISRPSAAGREPICRMASSRSTSPGRRQSSSRITKFPPTTSTTTIDRCPRSLHRQRCRGRAGNCPGRRQSRRFRYLRPHDGKADQPMAVSNQQGIFATVPTVPGPFACPNHGGNRVERRLLRFSDGLLCDSQHARMRGMENQLHRRGSRTYPANRIGWPVAQTQAGDRHRHRRQRLHP